MSKIYLLGTRIILLTCISTASLTALQAAPHLMVSSFSSSQPPQSQTSQSPNAVAQRLISSIEHDDAFKDILGASQQQKLIEVLHRVGERAPRDGDGCDTNGCGTGFAGPCGTSASSDLQVIEQTLCCIKNIIGTPCGSCCVGDACADLQTLFGFLACLCSKIDVIGGFESSVEIIESKLDVCCSQVNSKLDVIESFVEVIDSKLDELTPCAAIPLNAAVAISSISTTPGTTYCLTQNVSGAMIIDVDDTTLNLNGHIINGTIDIIGERAIVRDGKIMPQSVRYVRLPPTTAVTVENTAFQAHLLNLTIDCSQYFPLSDITGLNALQIGIFTTPIVNGLMTLVENCSITAGPSGAASDITTSATGGIGAIVISTGVQFTNCIIHGGNGAGSSDPAITTGSGGIGLAYVGGIGASPSENGVILASCTITGGNGGILTLSGSNIADTAMVSPIVLGNGGFGIFNQGVLCQINNCTVTAGDGTSITDANNVAINGGKIILGTGGVGCYCQTTNGDNTSVEGLVGSQSLFVGGTNGFISAAGDIGRDAGSQVVLGTPTPSFPLAPLPPHGIVLEGSAVCQFILCVAVGGSVGSVPLPSPFSPTGPNNAIESVFGGSIGGFGGQITINPGGDGISAGDTVGLSLQDTQLIGGSINRVALNRGSFIDRLAITNAGAGLTGLNIANASLLNCTVLSGIASDVMARSGTITSNTITGSAGNGINLIGAVSADINECIIAAQPANGSLAITNASICGNGGSGIVVQFSSPVSIRNTAFEVIGAGGANQTTGGSGIGTGIGGNAGSGIIIGNAGNIQIDNCILVPLLANGGNGQIAGAGGNGIVISDLGSLGTGNIPDITIRNTTINNMGLGGESTTGMAGKGGDGILIFNQSALDTISNIEINSCFITAAGNGGATSSGGIGGNGGNGIAIVKNNVINLIENIKITDSSITKAGDGGASTSGGTGGNGGAGILIFNPSTNSAIDTLIANVEIADCSISNTGKGGQASTGIGGSGGAGITVQNAAQNISIRNITINGTGSANNGSTSGGGTCDGGDGIFISSFVDTIEVGKCTISNTGSGLGGGHNGQAIRDLTCSAIIYSNLAYDIANATAYDMPSCIDQVAVDALNTPPGTPFLFGGGNFLQNLYK